MKSRQLIAAIIAALMVISFSQKANSQVLISLLLGDKLNSEKLKFGLDGGVNFANISNIDPSNFKAHFNLGFYFDFLLKEKTPWYLHTGVLVKSTMGAQRLNTYTIGDADLDSLFVDGTIERKLSYFNVPILVRYKQGNSSFYLFASLPVGAGEKAKAKAEAKKQEKEQKKEMKEKK